MNAVAFHIELPGMEHAGHVLWRARWRSVLERARRPILNHVAAVWAYVQEGSNLVVGTADHHYGLTGDRHGSEAVGIW